MAQTGDPEYSDFPIEGKKNPYSGKAYTKAQVTGTRIVLFIVIAVPLALLAGCAAFMIGSAF